MIENILIPLMVGACLVITTLISLEFIGLIRDNTKQAIIVIMCLFGLWVVGKIFMLLFGIKTL